MTMSAYLIGKKVYPIATERTADPTVPRTLPIGSPSLTQDEALDLAAQLIEQANKPLPSGTFKPLGAQ